MNLNLKEAYIREVESHLGNLNAINRASVIKELEKSIAELENDGTGKDIEAILRFFGEPKSKARELLVPYGLQISKSRSAVSLFKLMMGIAAFFFILIATMIIVAVIKYTPLISIDSDSNSVKLLGGTINIDTHDTGLNSNIIQITKGASAFSGQLAMNSASRVKVLFSNANFNIKNADHPFVEYQCEKSPLNKDTDFTNQDDEKVLILDFKELSGVDCDISVPMNVSLEIQGENLNILLSKLSNDILVKAQNGKIEFEPLKEDHYNFDLSLSAGVSSNFPTNQDPKFYNVKLELENGMMNYLK